MLSLQELVNNGAIVSIENILGEIPLEKAKPGLAKTLQGEIVF